ncbi:ABC-type transport system, ATPase component [Aster yellows witches'-broom phytoplasma AYWB]|uniref:ABC-type transport system, ATPase component n=1 Tax=Aster yellows witches'-broom phytoplasma (strain AYWB) TaxID=322098 RepID=Q2NIK7_AYWBP|nr:ATP-binding cassette domain-containing protein [Aster yellows witches'-broom phytoplasma]ABC65736.1 ABC-type transport system, ATPase component [Aster yellows witches'-broom phytoplasma AYWB]
MLKINNLFKKIQNTEVIENVSFQLPQKGLVFITGKSGSGKSTLLNLMGALDKPTKGNITVLGRNINEFVSFELDSYRNYFLGFVFQEYNLLDNLTVFENIQMVCELQSKSVDNWGIQQILKQVELDGLETHYPNQLSGGQKQRVSIARALIKNPKMILADEPTGNLDEKTGKKIFECLKQISKDTLVVVVSHNTQSAYKYADRIIEFADGKIAKDLTKKANKTSTDKPQILQNKTYTQEEVFNLLKQKNNVMELDFTPTLANENYNYQHQAMHFPLVQTHLSKQTALLVTRNILKNNKKLAFKIISTSSNGALFLTLSFLMFFNMFLWFCNLGYVTPQSQIKNKTFWWWLLAPLLFHIYFLGISFYQIIIHMRNIITLKNKDIGILKSLGASDQDIRKIFHHLNIKLTIIQFLGIPLFFFIFVLLMVISASLQGTLDSFLTFLPKLCSSLKAIVPLYLFLANIVLFFVLVFAYPFLLNHVSTKNQLKKVLKKNPLTIILSVPKS